MQHTEKYQLNLIETSDTFSPDPLNENMAKLEAAIAAEAAAQDQARAADVAALDQRLQVFEAHKLAIGVATRDSNFMYLGFKPRVMIAQGVNAAYGIYFEGAAVPSGLGFGNDGFYHQGTFAVCYFVAFT